MARKTITKLFCDRCPREIEEVGGEEVATSDRPYIVLEMRDGTTVEIQDVCPKCSNRISVLVDQIRLEKTAKEAKTNGVDDTTEEPMVPPVEEPQTEENADATA